MKFLSVNEKEHLALHGQPTSELQDVTWSVTCHLTCWTCPTLTPAMQAGTWLTYPRGMERWVDLGGRLRTQMVYPPADGRPSKYHATTSVFIQRHLDISPCVSVLPSKPWP